MANRKDYEVVFDEPLLVNEGGSTLPRVRNDEMNLAWQFITQTNTSVFLTGKAGTGKTTFLKKLKELTPKRMVVLAPTGVAAINAAGQTIHSFFQLPFGPNIPGIQKRDGQSHFRMGKEKKQLIKTIDLLVIDEISMVRCDLLDAIDTELRKHRDRNKPFGGVQLLLIGDLQQLAPVAKESEWQLLSDYYPTPYFFSSKALAQIQYVTVELKHIYRQQDKDFIQLLGRVRENKLDTESIQLLNSRYIPNFRPQEGENWIRLTTHNYMAQQYNEQQLAMLPSNVHWFHAEIKKNFPESSYPADYALALKINAQVMFIKNDASSAHAYYNGKIGTITDITAEGVTVYCPEDNKQIVVTPDTWENTKYVIDPITKSVSEEIEGTFTQYPLRLAWAITVHKSQGLTFEHAVLDIADSFTHGQAYVALSRCRTLEGLVLAFPLRAESVINDQSVDAFIQQSLTLAQTASTHLPQLKYQYAIHLLNEMFSFQNIEEEFRRFQRVVDEFLLHQQPLLSSLLATVPQSIKERLTGIAVKFQTQYNMLMQQCQGNLQNDQLQSRLKDASSYFYKQMHAIFDPVLEATTIQIDNKQISERYNNALEAFLLALKIKTGIFQHLKEEDFSVKNYLSAKAVSALDDIKPKRKRKQQETMLQQKPKLDPERMSLEEQANEKSKKQKGDSRRESLRLYQEGLTIKQIATERSLNPTTIEGHLAYFASHGELDINDFVSPVHQRIIQQAIEQMTGSYTLSDLKAVLPADYTYMEIKVMVEREKR